MDSISAFQDPIPVLLVDREEERLELMRKSLKADADFRICSSCDVKEGLSLLECEGCQVVVSGCQVLSPDGMKLLNELRSRGRLSSLIQLVEDGMYELPTELLNGEADLLFHNSKGPVPTELITRIRRCAQLQRVGQMLDVCQRELATQREIVTHAEGVKVAVEALFYNSLLSMLVIDPETMRIIDANESALRMNHVRNLQEMQELEPWTDPPYSREDAEYWLRRTTIMGPQRTEWRSRRGDGSLQWESLLLHIIYVQGRRMLLVTGLNIDEEMKRGDSLQLANRKLQLLGRVTHHDVMNDLSAARAYLELLSDGKMGMETAYDRICTPLKKIEERMAFSREYEKLGMREFQWQELYSMVSRLIPRGMDAKLTCQGSYLLADPLLPRVFENLLDNSLRHGVGLTWVGVSCEQVRDELHVLWEDDGGGIQPEMKEKVFLRGVGSNTGLGLFLSWEILEFSEMRIQEDGEYGKGVRFRIIAPPGRWRQLECRQSDK